MARIPEYTQVTELSDDDLIFMSSSTGYGHTVTGETLRHTVSFGIEDWFPYGGEDVWYDFEENLNADYGDFYNGRSNGLWIDIATDDGYSPVWLPGPEEFPFLDDRARTISNGYSSLHINSPNVTKRASITYTDKLVYSADWAEMYRRLVSGTADTVEMPSNITEYPHAAFLNQTSLTRIVLPVVDSISTVVFGYCTAMTDIWVGFSSEGDVPELASVNAFNYCSSLETIHVPPFLLDEYQLATNWSSYADILVGDFDPIREMEADGEILDALTIWLWRWSNACPSASYSGLSRWSVPSLGLDRLLYVGGQPSGVNYNQNGADDEWAEVDLPAIMQIGRSAFYSRANLMSVKAPSLCRVMSYAFQSADGLTDMLTSPTCCFENYACRYAEGLETVGYEEGREQAAWVNQHRAFIESFWGDSSADWTVIGNYAFDGCTALTEFRQGTCLFDQQAQVGTMGIYAFTGCTALVTFESGMVYNVGNYAFYNNESLSDVTIPYVKTVGNYAFYGCTSLESLDLPIVTSIGNYAFCNSSLTYLYLGGSSLCSLGTNAFYGTPIADGEGLIMLSSRSLILQYAMYWSDYADVLGYYIDDDETEEVGISEYSSDTYLASVSMTAVTSIGNLAFANCTSLVSASFPVCVSVGISSFSGCTSLTDIYLPLAETISTQTFNACSSLESIDLPSLTYIGSESSVGTRAFQNCTSLTSVSMPSLIGVIPPYTFYNCSSLTTVSAPYATGIGSYAFYGSAIGNVHSSSNIFSSATYVDSYAFGECDNLGIMSLPSCETIYEYAFYNSGIVLFYLKGSVLCELESTNAFDGTYISRTTAAYIFVNDNRYDEYCYATNWSYFYQTGQLWPVSSAGSVMSGSS